MTFLLSTVKTDKNWTAFRDYVERPGIAERGLKHFLQYLDLDWKQFFIKINIDVKAYIQGGGMSVGDETIWPWRVKDPAIEVIERKPNSTGFKVLSLFMELTRTKRYTIEFPFYSLTM